MTTVRAAAVRGRLEPVKPACVKALSIRQPWAWLILHGGKDIENRTWPTRSRGRVLIHASKGMTRAEYEDAKDPLWASRGPTIELPSIEQLAFGGIIGSVEIVDCVTESDSPWFTGPFGFVLTRPEKLPFVPLKGQLGFFEVDQTLLPAAYWFEVAP